MSKEQKKSKGWPKIGTVRKNDDGKSYIKLADNVTLLVDGKEVPMNKYRTVSLQDPRKEVERLHELGYITDADLEKRQEKLAEMDWLRFELVVAPPKAE